MANARMRIFGADEREADFCGNGALLTLHLLFDERQSGGDPPGERVLETASGVKRGIRQKNDHVSVEVGGVTNLDAEIDELTLSRLDDIGVNFEGFRIPGEPHIVVSARPGSPVINQSRREFEAMARSIARFFKFDGGVNVTLIVGQDDCGLRVRTYERGVQRMTGSCGSGAVAAASTCINGNACASTTVISPGGEHQVWTDQDARQWWLSAPATPLRWRVFPELAAWLRACSLRPLSAGPLDMARDPGRPKFRAPDVRQIFGFSDSDGSTPPERHN